MSLPLVIIFERHWDTIPKILIRDLLPCLGKLGYRIICLESPQDLPFPEMLRRSQADLKFSIELHEKAKGYLTRVGITGELSLLSFSKLVPLTRLYVSSQKYLEVAEKVKSLPATRIIQDIFNTASKHLFSVKGVDIDDPDFTKLITPNLATRMVGIRANEEYRIATVSGNLMKMKEEEEGVLYLFAGSWHAEGLLAEFKKNKVDNDVLYYFPHSAANYDDGVDDIQTLTKETHTLVGHTHLLSEKEIGGFIKQIVKEIKEKIKYKTEVPEGNSHSQILSELFGVPFRIFLRAGHYADALVATRKTPQIEHLKETIEKAGIEVHHTTISGEDYLVVPGVNTREVADKIRSLKRSKSFA